MKIITLGQKDWILKSITQETNRWLRMHNCSDEYTLTDAYKYPSWAKKHAWDFWCEWLDTWGAYDIKIDSHSHFYFTIGAMIEVGSKKYLLHITAHNIYAVELK